WNLPGGVWKTQLARLINTIVSRPGKRKPDAPRIGARRDDEIVFELFLIATPDQIYAGIDVFVFDPRVIYDVRSPTPRIVAEKVVQSARQLIQPNNACLRIRANQSHLQDCGLRIGTLGLRICGFS